MLFLQTKYYVKKIFQMDIPIYIVKYVWLDVYNPDTYLDQIIFSFDGQPVFQSGQKVLSRFENSNNLQKLVL